MESVGKELAVWRRGIFALLFLCAALVSACTPPEKKPLSFEEHLRIIKGEALKEMKTRADGGDTQSQMVLGNLYYRGEEVKQDLPMAIEWFLKAAAGGHPEAQYAMGMIYYRGEGVERDPRRAAGWLKKAAAQGQVRAQALLAHIYYNGETGVKEMALAKEYFQMAADAGDPDAQHFLARMYEHGDGVAQSHSAAALWYCNSGLAWAKQGRRDDAMANMDAIKRIAPEDEHLKLLRDAIHATPKREKK